MTMNTHVRSKALRPLLRDQMVQVCPSRSLRWSNDIRKPDAPLHVVAMLQLMLQAAPRAARCVACKRFVSNAAGRRMRRSATATQAHGQPAAVAPPSAVDEWEGLRGWRAAGVNTNRRRVASRHASRRRSRSVQSRCASPGADAHRFAACVLRARR